MSIFTTILLHTEEPLPVVAERLQHGLDLVESTDDGGRVFLYRVNPSASVRRIGGEIATSIYRSLPGLPEEEYSLLDGYAYAWDVDTDPRGDDVLAATGRALFRDVVAATSWPAALVHNHAHLLAAWSPETGLVEFDPPISTDGDARGRWRAFDVLGRPG